MKTNRMLTGACLAATLAFAGCSKDETTATDPTSEAADFEQFEQITNDADAFSDEALSGNTSGMRTGDPSVNSIQGCAVVTNDSINHVLTLDFGTGCTGHDGRVRSGQVIVAYNGHYLDPGFYRNITFNNYFVDGNQVTGSRSITNNGLNNDGHLTWSIIAQNLRITKPSGYYHEWNSTRTRELILGDGTPHWIFDDVYLITGSGSSVNSNGGSTTVTITQPLRKELSCRWIVSGTVEITPLNHPVRTLDYGNGNCDRNATVTVNGVTRNIVLH